MTETISIWTNILRESDDAVTFNKNQAVIPLTILQGIIDNLLSSHTDILAENERLKKALVDAKEQAEYAHNSIDDFNSEIASVISIIETALTKKD